MMKIKLGGVLILGAPRSGTTLLTAMVGRHSEIAMLNEHFGRGMGDVVSKRYVGNKLCVPNQIELDRRGGLAVRSLQKIGLLKDRPESNFSIKDYVAHGEVRFIGIVRPGSAVIGSIMKRGGQSLARARYRWSRAVQVLHDLRRDVGDRLLLITFDQLLSNPEETMRIICAFLELPFEKRMLEGYQYTPIYSNEGIDRSKVQSEDARAEEELRVQYPDILRLYDRLVDECLTDLEKWKVVSQEEAK